MNFSSLAFYGIHRKKNFCSYLFPSIDWKTEKNSDIHGKALSGIFFFNMEKLHKKSVIHHKKNSYSSNYDKNSYNEFNRKQKHL